MLRCLSMQIATPGWILHTNDIAHVSSRLRRNIQAESGSAVGQFHRMSLRANGLLRRM